MFLTSGEDSHSSREREKTQRERENTQRERERSERKKEKKKLSSLFVFALLFLSLSLVFFLALLFLALLSLSLKSLFSLRRSVSRFPLSRNSDMNLREVFRERHFAAQKRALQREKRERERERERDERERARERTLFTDGSFSPLLFLSAITARN